ncbi:MAG TPA: DUF4388 domain-containing protein [Pyrinomonadaceae bacterium]
MPLTGEINDLSLSELIEVFCNRRKAGCLTVEYPQGTAQFYLKPGAIVHAAFEDLNGVEAVHYALTLPNASFSFQSEVEATEKSIDQPWTSVVLDGLRKIDEGVVPVKPSANGNGNGRLHHEIAAAPPQIISEESSGDVQAFGVLLSQYPDSAPSRRWVNVPVLVAIVLIVLGIGVPWGWYTRHKASQVRREADDKKFEHLYAPNNSSSQPAVNARSNESTAAGTSERSAEAPSPEDKPKSNKSP